MKTSDLNRLKRCVLYYEKIEELLSTATDSCWKHSGLGEKIGAPGHRISVYQTLCNLHRSAVENLSWLKLKIKAIEQEGILTK